MSQRLPEIKVLDVADATEKRRQYLHMVIADWLSNEIVPAVRVVIVPAREAREEAGHIFAAQIADSIPNRWLMSF